MNVETFCNAFLHIENTPEANLEEFCLCDKVCSRKTVTCVACVYMHETLLYQKTFTNETNERLNTVIHAEESMTEDSELLQFMNKASLLKLYITYNPCHFSGGHKGWCNRKSCTLRLIRLSERFPCVDMEIVVAYTYRAHWRISGCRCLPRSTAPEKYAPNILKAQEGIFLLQKKGIFVRSFQPLDYDFLVCLMDENVKSVWKSRRDEILQKRAEIDAFVTQVLTQYSERHGFYWKCQTCHVSTEHSQGHNL